MAVDYRDGNGLARVRKGTGAGTGGDPDIIEFLESNSAAIKTAVEAIKTAVEVIDNMISGSEAQVDVASVAVPAAIYSGRTAVTTATTRVALAGSQAILSGVTIKAYATNTGIIYVGGSTVAAANGFSLYANQQIFLEVANLATVYLDSTVNLEGVCWIAS